MTDQQNIGRWLSAHPADKKALVFEDGRSWSYAELDGWSVRIVAMLASQHGVTRGDRVAFLGFNDPFTIAMLFACARLGAILVPINWRLAPAEVCCIADDCAPNVLFYSGEFEEAAEQCPCPRVPMADLEEDDALESEFEQAGEIDDPLLIVYTSGTTGRPKGAVLTQRALHANALGSIHMHRMEPSDGVLVVLPLFHVGGLNIALTPALFCGATVHLHAKFDPAMTLAALQDIGPQIVVLVPATLQALMGMPGWGEADLSSLRMLTTGSMIVPLALIEAYEARGVSVMQVYGSTETCPVAAYTEPGKGKSNPRSTGRAGCQSELRIVDADGNPMPPGEDGEIEVRGAHVMQGYWNRPDETAGAFRGDWFRTGDIGALDEEGNLYFRERSKHMIISGGENIYPAEIERVIAATPGCQECAVCGVPDEKWGEVPAAVVVRNSYELTAAVLKARFDTELARFKHPKIIHFADALPRNVMGKVVHDRLREMIGKT